MLHNPPLFTLGIYHGHKLQFPSSSSQIKVLCASIPIQGIFQLVQSNSILLVSFLVYLFIALQYASLRPHPFVLIFTFSVDASLFLLSRELIGIDDSPRLSLKTFANNAYLSSQGQRRLFLSQLMVETCAGHSHSCTAATM